MNDIMPEAVARAVQRLRMDAADFMHHSTTSAINTRRMCRVGVSEMALLLAWLDQHHPATSIPETVLEP
jgi:hypothetical protein